jgi:DedD protein
MSVERSKFKQRMVGGLVLVALGAIVLPFLLDMHRVGEWWGESNIPKKPVGGFVTRVLPLQDWSKQAQSELEEGAKHLDAVPDNTPVGDVAGEPPASVQPSPASGAVLPPAVKSSSPVPSAESKPAAAVGGTATEGWVVQLGSFASLKNAEELRERLRKKDYRAYVENIKQDGQAVYRVRIGPERQRSDAETLRDRVAHDLHLNAIVLHLP